MITEWQLFKGGGWGGDRPFSDKFITELNGVKRIKYVFYGHSVKQRLSRVCKIIYKANLLNIPSQKIKQFYRHGDKYNVVLEWIEGENLEEVLNAYTTSEQFDTGVQAGKILKRIHCELNINHGDYRPANLLIDEAKNVHVIDWFNLMSHDGGEAQYIVDNATNTHKTFMEGMMTGYTE